MLIIFLSQNYSPHVTNSFCTYTLLGNSSELVLSLIVIPVWEKNLSKYRTIVVFPCKIYVKITFLFSYFFLNKIYPKIHESDGSLYLRNTFWDCVSPVVHFVGI